ncbi:hypothetical protein OWR29_24230 [Actinoplanes sp. Pm04-4]|uniref:Uncharacterized protein n=1 Tax=Paractinoplanes pyxinae TaxID=2997416 RepID=A0ABT4B680_9ACTN|nr:hypothetical protein [Actinoplanes pyxinae]MCY1141118.1 hypothetical protein [Actinoplanes pyxinae]
MVQRDWQPDESDRQWLPAIDVRAVVAAAGRSSVSLDDFPQIGSTFSAGSAAELRSAVEGLGSDDAGRIEESLTRLRWLVCSDGNTGVAGPFIVPALLRVAGSHRAEALQLVGDMARVDSLRMEAPAGSNWALISKPPSTSSRCTTGSAQYPTTLI